MAGPKSPQMRPNLYPNPQVRFDTVSTNRVVPYSDNDSKIFEG